LRLRIPALAGEKIVSEAVAITKDLRLNMMLESFFRSLKPRTKEVRGLARSVAADPYGRGRQGKRAAHI